MKFTIIGGGIGGLTTAIALLQKGFAVEIFEAASEIRPIGAGIILANNAMQIYQKLGLETAMQKNGHRISKLSLADSQIKAITTIDLKNFEKKYNTFNIGIHRGKLQSVLLDQIPKASIFTGKKLTGLSHSEKGVELQFADGSTHFAELLIAADGIHSSVRKTLFPKSKIRSAKQVCWRGIAKMDIPERYRKEVFECWGKGERFGIVPIGKNIIYWFALQDFQVDFRKEFTDFDIQKLGVNFHPFIQKILAATPRNQIHLDEITDLEPLPYWHTKNICLIGDAAHATTPNMGQGAGQAIEDAWILSELIQQESSPEMAFKQFELIRRKKVSKIVNMSWQIGKMAHWENSFAVGLRNTVMRMTPQFLSEKQSEEVFTVANVKGRRN